MASVFLFKAIGTEWRIDIKDSLSPERESFLLERAQERIAAYDAVYSRFRTDSVVAEMSRAAGVYALPDDSVELFALYKKMYDVTEGRVTPLIGGVLVSAGYDAAYSLVQNEPLVKPPSWDEALAYVPGTLTVRMPVQIDIGAGGKGYLVDIVGALLELEGIQEYVINAGGDIRQRTQQADILRVGLENPFDFSEAVGVARVHNESICGSAGSRRAWGEFHHIIDPEILASPKHIAAVWVTARSTFLADMLTTALFFVSAQVLQKEFAFEYAILHADMTIERSNDFEAEFFKE